MLDESRKDFITASQAHRVMAGFEQELEGMNSKRPDVESFDAISEFVTKNNKKPLVSNMKKLGVAATGADINECYKHIKSLEPVFSEGMQSVAEEIAMSHFISARDKSFKSDDMERGNLQEGEAIKELQIITGIKFSNTEDNQLFLSDGLLGATPDGIEYDGFDIKSCAEVKNPKDTTHMKYLSRIKDQQSLLDVSPLYYWQAQCGLAVSNADTYHWMSYHKEYFKDTRRVYVAVTPVQEHIDLLKIRAERVFEKVPVIVKDIKERYSI